MGTTARMALAYGLAVAEYLLAASALFGALRIAVPPPPGGHTLLATLGVVALAMGLLGALTALTTSLRHTGQDQQRPGWGLVSVAARAAGTGLLWGAIGLAVVWIFGLPLFTWPGNTS